MHFARLSAKRRQWRPLLCDRSLFEWYRRRCSGVRKAHRLAFGTGNWLLRYGILLLLRRLLGEFKDCRGKVAVAAGILVEVVLVVLLGFVETAEGL